MIEVAARVFVSTFAVYEDVPAESVLVCAERGGKNQLGEHDGEGCADAAKRGDAAEVGGEREEVRVPLTASLRPRRPDLSTQIRSAGHGIWSRRERWW